ncbi:hypothetical protein QLQ86_18215 [Halomonas sp. LR5S13]|uniref:hypothetical protein n=1 Tax=Halomonas rhizosphaerae TaxID=3043296 RepID=UPI0024A8DAA0|nr:hypothetical protein [Halomonas rhizosphaerae]MDI5922708.1 hypothetical protein [Halomonas rhizosphaerae]
MSDNPFSSYNVLLPKKHGEAIRGYCAQSNSRVSREQAPFDRQVDFWYCSFLIAIKEKYHLEEAKDTYNVTPASILSSDGYRITHIQSAYLSITGDLDGLANNRKVFDFANDYAIAGTPYLLQILGEMSQKPLWNILDKLEQELG